jgi:hypothetical protein
MFSAQLRLPGNMTNADKHKKVDATIEELVLFDLLSVFDSVAILGRRPPAVTSRSPHARCNHTYVNSRD